ncbi:vascular endothelial zinc finger 1-like [Cephus cinctus]|uniref:Vascular endothelial zinc finger 1-like n=1 Tax=Cephus cinctus TaxID=211228 RepID=A0AAJ7VXV4_CEPCN|nr:vascular endothelial zinc finger 1-like [Cephus cinctus]XP_024937204.1 vascular endothelial zinc finger 1-like [Cephus cinctus]
MTSSQDVRRLSTEMSWMNPDFLGAQHKITGKSTSRRKDSDAKDSNGHFICNRCGKSYRATTSLSRHKRLECGVVPCEVCPICNRRFKHKFVLKSHILVCERKLREIMLKKAD